MDWTSQMPLWDHHCHALVDTDHRSDMQVFARTLTEAPSDYPLHDIHETVTYWNALKIAAQHLHVDCGADAVAEALDASDYPQYCRSLFHEQGYERLLIDTGYQPHSAWSLDSLSDSLALTVHPILRLETLAEKLLPNYPSLDEWTEAIAQQLRSARTAGYVGVKSIVAYRSGLQVYPVHHADAKAAMERMKQTGETRLTDPVLLNYLLWLLTPVLIEQSLPLQFHTGHGDPDTDLLKGNPLLLRDYLREFLPKGHYVALLHTYPYHREAGYLASVYPNVYFDVSLALPLAATGGVRIVQEALELAPVSRFLFASDAHSRPESFYLAAELWKAGINIFLDQTVQIHGVPSSKAEQWASMICWENCRALYHL